MKFVDRLPRNAFVLFSPFLVLFIVYAVKAYTQTFEGDEVRYITFANNLINGFYSPPAPNIDLWNAPGYPLLIVPFVAVGIPNIIIVLLNAFFQYLSIVLLFRSLEYFTSYSRALFFSLIWALCFSTYSYISMILTEPFTVFLVSLMTYSIIRSLKEESKKYVYVAGITFGYLVLTKAIFGYAMLLALGASVLLWLLFRKRSDQYGRTAFIMLIAFAVNLPYLFYTFSLTGKAFYWSNAGGMSLYWMSTPYENEYGDWNNEMFTANDVDGAIARTEEHLRVNHQKDMELVQQYTGVEKDDMYKKLAVENIKNHPAKFVKNVYANITRMIFGAPGTYTYQRPMLRTWYFSVVFTLLLASFIALPFYWRKVDHSVRVILGVTLLYLALSSVVSGDVRQFAIVLPALLLVVGVVAEKAVLIRRD